MLRAMLPAFALVGLVVALLPTTAHALGGGGVDGFGGGDGGGGGGGGGFGGGFVGGGEGVQKEPRFSGSLLTSSRFSR